MIAITTTPTQLLHCAAQKAVTRRPSAVRAKAPRCVAALAFLALSGALLHLETSSASAQFAEETLVLTPSFGGPTDSFTATYDVNSGGCQDPDGKMVHFYWFGGASSISVIGKVPLVRCVASLTTVPPAGTPPGEYAVGGDLFSPGGVQRPQSGMYRVDSAARPRSSPAPSARPSPTSTAPGAAVSGGSGGGPGGGKAATEPSAGGDAGRPREANEAAKGATASFAGEGTGGPGGAVDAAKGGLEPSVAQNGAPTPSDSSADGFSGRHAAGASRDCGMREANCRVDSKAGDRRQGVLPVAAVLVLLAVALLALSAWARRRRRSGPRELVSP